MKPTLALATALSGTVISTLLAQAPVDLEALSRLDRLPALHNSLRIGSVSSYDRTGGNDDGFSGKYSFVRKDPDALVLADLAGPGVIYRVWTPTPSDDLLEFLFDGEKEPRIAVKFRELFLGNSPGFPSPLVGFGAGGFYSYVPIPFAKRCVVRLRGPKAQFYQINYAVYGPETGIVTYNVESAKGSGSKLEEVCKLWENPGKDLSRLTSPPGATVHVDQSLISLKPKESAKVFSISKGGRIAGLRLTPAEAVNTKARDLLLKISYDGEESAVFCPLGDFFGYAWGQPAMQSLLLGTVGSTNYCYFPMPFERSAKIELVSEREAPVEIRSEVAYTDMPRARDEGKFYALWRRENPTKIGEPFIFLETAGRGHLVGLVLQAQGFESGKTLFFEGDDQTTVDGELVVHGTGSEDFFNGGWYDVPDRWEKRISFPLSGCLGYAKHLGRTGAYRLFLGDAYAYRNSLKQTIEHAGEKNSIPTDYSAVTFFYSDERPSVNLAPPPLAERKVQDPTEMIFPAFWQIPLHSWSFDRASLTRRKEKIAGEEVRFLSLTAQGDDWFGPPFMSVVIDIPERGRHAIYIEAVNGPGQGKVQLFHNENPVGQPGDLYSAEAAKSGRVLLGHLDLNQGANNLMLKLVGKNEQSTGLGLDLIQVVCVREP
jgi:hypothetical protein